MGQQIQKYDGLLNQWVQITDDLPDPYIMTRGFYWETDLAIYAMADFGLETEILSWDGAAWTSMTTPMEDIKPEMHFVSPTEIYAVIGNRICVWNGTMWTPWTQELTRLQTAFSFVANNDIYAVAGVDKVWRWAP